MKTLFTSDYAAWCFLASFPIAIVAVLLTQPAIAAVAILLFYASLDVLGWKWIVNGRRFCPGCSLEGWDGWSDYYTPAPEVILAYRLIQHGVMIPVLAAAWHVVGWQAAAAPFLVWITFGADIAYFVIGREQLPAWTDETYFGYAYWNAPYGWVTWLAAKSAGVPTPPMNAGILYGQVILGYLVAIWMLT